VKPVARSSRRNEARYGTRLRCENRHARGLDALARICPPRRQTIRGPDHSTGSVIRRPSEPGRSDVAALPERRHCDTIRLTRLGICKLVRRHSQWLDAQPGPRAKHVTPHTFRDAAAVHLLESGVEINLTVRADL
jgi:integrase